jgi:hypothetical protein
VNLKGNGRRRLDETSVRCPPGRCVPSSWAVLAEPAAGCLRRSSHALGSNLDGDLMRAPRSSVGASRQPGQMASGVAD